MQQKREKRNREKREERIREVERTKQDVAARTVSTALVIYKCTLMWITVPIEVRATI